MDVTDNTNNGQTHIACFIYVCYCGNSVDDLHIPALFILRLYIVRDQLSLLHGDVYLATCIYM